MRPASIAALLALASAAVAAAAPALAQSYSSYGSYRSHEYGYGHEDRRWDGDARRGYDFNGQADRPGDYRCDRSWDAGRTDCGAAWRDRRPVRHPGWSDRYWAPGYGPGRYPGRPVVYPGPYGRPDLVYPGGGVGYAPDDGYGPPYGGGYGGTPRDPYRVAWCRASYRSYDPASGFYRTYDGRLIFCG